MSSPCYLYNMPPYASFVQGVSQNYIPLTLLLVKMSLKVVYDKYIFIFDKVVKVCMLIKLKSPYLIQSGHYFEVTKK